MLICVWGVCICTWYICISGVFLNAHQQCCGVQVCVCSLSIVWSVCKYKRDTEAHGQGELECSGHVTKLGLVLTLPRLFGESRAINGDPFWTSPVDGSVG